MYRFKDIDIMQQYLVVFVLVSSCYGYSLHEPMENPNLYEGDIAGISIDPNDRNAIPTDSKRWPYGIIYYTIDSDLSHMKSNILKAIKYIEDRTCLLFLSKRSTSRNYIRFIDDDGCYSFWGCTGGEQPISLGNGCNYLGTIIHELTHAIGFKHEQSRSDRDDYLTIYYQNIKPGLERQFQKLRPHENRLINNFDYDSIMIYDDTAFSIDGYKKTMKPKKKGVKLVSSHYKMPTDSDMYRINWLYKCKDYL